MKSMAYIVLLIKCFDDVTMVKLNNTNWGRCPELDLMKEKIEDIHTGVIE